MSNESRWPRPPVRKTRIIDFARGPAAGPGRGPAGQQAGQAQAEEAREADLEELAADDPVGVAVGGNHHQPLQGGYEG